MAQEQNQIVIASQQSKLIALTSTNLSESKKRYLELHYGCKKVEDYDKEDLKKLFKFILALCKLVGVTEAPDNEIIILLIDHIQEHHKDFSKEEIQKAFSMATAGKLDFDFVHYNRITPQLISNTLNYYKKIRSKEIIEFQNKLRLEEDEKKRNENKPSQKELLIEKIELCLDYFNSYKEGKSNGNIIDMRDWGSLRYDFLSEIGLINYTNEQKIEIKKNAKARLIERKTKSANEFNRKGLIKFIEEINSNGSHSALISESKQIALEDYLRSLIDFELSLESLVKEKLISHNEDLYVEIGKMINL